MKTKTTNTNIKRADKNGGETPAIEVSFRPADQDRVIRLLGRFGGCSGDTTSEEAATKLASKALFLSNIASGHMRARADGRDCELGMDFIVEGGMASADFVDSVIAPAAWIQARWERNLLHDPLPKATARPQHKTVMEVKMTQDGFDSMLTPVGRARRNFAKCQEAYCKQPLAKPDQATSGRVIPSSIQQDIQLMPNDMVSVPLILERRATLLREATEFPFFLSQPSGVASLRSRAARAHLGHLIVHSRLESPACLERLRRILSGAGERDMSGRSEGSPTVRLNQALCASSKVLDEALAAARNQPGKVAGHLWLVETSPGCGLPGGMTESPAFYFRIVCELKIMERINFADDRIHGLEALNGWLSDWRRFLREQERHLPGIAITAWNLPVALCYGLEALLGHDAKMDGGEVIALAKWLVLRMSNRFAAAAPGSHIDSVQVLAKELAEKLLRKGPTTRRDLLRSRSKLKMADCQPALDWLSEQGIVAYQGDRWGIVCDAKTVLELIGESAAQRR